MIISVTVADKKARAEKHEPLVCGNSDYIVKFKFDAEWTGYDVKTARFIFSDHSYIDVVFRGDECAVPVLKNTHEVLVGVYAGDLKTTTPAYLRAYRSILCGEGAPVDPDPDVYHQIMELLNKGGTGSSVTPEQIQQAVDNYLTEHPVQTEETDPTVPDWAKQPKKPSYTAKEVDAISADAEIVDATARQSIGENAKEIATLSEEKVDKTQGTDNALKLLFVADDGNVSALTAESGVEVQTHGDETDESIIVNLWKPDNYEMGVYNNGGNKTTSETALRSKEWIEVTPNAEYSAYFIAQPGLGTTLFFYDENGVFLSKQFTGTLLHFNTAGIKYVSFHVARWYEKYHDRAPEMMLWRTTSTEIPTEYVEYGRYDKPRLVAPGVEKNAADILTARRSAFDDQFLNIAYSSIHRGIINTAEHFLMAAKLGYNALKCDVQPTSDGELALCHDSGFTFDTNGRIVSTYDESNSTQIITLTATEVAALEYAGSQDAQDYYSHPCFLDDFVCICKEKGKIAFITIRDDYIPDVVAPKLLEIVKKYNMVSRTIVNSFNIESLRAVRNLNSEICLHQVGTRNQVLTKARVDQVNALGNAMLGIYMHPAGTDSTVLAESAEAIQYAQKKGLRVLGAISGTYTEYNECVASGLAGTQIDYAILPYSRELLTFSVAVSDGVATFSNTNNAERYAGEAVMGADEITVKNIKLMGSTRNFPDGIPPIVMKRLPHRMEIVSTSGQTCNVTYSNHAWHITAANITADDTYKVYIEI